MNARTFVLVAAFAFIAAVATPALSAEPAPKPGATYQKERADCDAGRTAEDRATCMREAGAAKVERARDGLTPAARQAAVDRCKGLPEKERSDCMARIDGPNKPNQTVTTTGSVAGGGILRETRTITTGKPVLVPAPGASAAKPN